MIIRPTAAGTSGTAASDWVAPELDYYRRGLNSFSAVHAALESLPSPDSVNHVLLGYLFRAGKSCKPEYMYSSMKLTSYTDYALRVLMHLAVQPDRLTSISTIARAYGISQNHLVKVVQDLRVAGYVQAVRGRAGGIRLGRLPEEINVGEVVRHTEEGFDLVDCAHCLIAPACALTAALHRALAAFMEVLDSYTLADLVGGRSEALRRLLSVPADKRSLDLPSATL